MTTVTEKTSKSPAEIAKEERARQRKEEQEKANAAEKVKKAKAPKAPKAKKAKPAKAQEGKQDSSMDKIVAAMQRKEGATTAELAAISGWKNAGWNTILASLAERRGLKLKSVKREVEGSKRKVNVWHVGE